MGFRDIFAHEPEEDLAEIAEQEALAANLKQLNEELELYRSPLWRHFELRLYEAERSATEEVINGPPEGMALARERIKLARYLASIPATLEQERARVLEDLSSEKDDDTW